MKLTGRVGNVDVARVFDSYLLGETAQTFFPEFDRESLRPHEHWLCPTHYDPESGHIRMPVQSWLLRVGDQNVLIDTCLGNHKSRPDKHEMHMLNTRYLERLQGVGMRPEDIDYVLCTHLHVDHVGWNTRLENGRWVPTFANARYVWSKTEYEAAKCQAMKSDCSVSVRQVFQDSIQPVVETRKADMIDGEFGILDGVVLNPAAGHTPGHLRIEVRSQGAVGLFVGDILHSPIQVPLWSWSTRYCWDRAMAAQERRRVLEICAAENALLLPAHFEAPHVGRVTAAGESFALALGW
jgi:glyoxylase-like metal-dependent hydrolase (beta-lactamase superfamily II)